MDLIDLIGDSKTDSLPPGFLRSIKIKYRQEASHVFPRSRGGSVKPLTAAHTDSATGERGATTDSTKSTPSFMGWRVPPRLLSRPPAPIPRTPATAISLCQSDRERQHLSSRLSAQMSLKSAGSLVKPSKMTEHLPRLNSVASSRKSPSEKSKAMLPKLTAVGCDDLAGLEKRDNVTLSAQGKRVINKILSEAEKETEKNVKPISSNVMAAVDKWLATASDKEREVALKFFSTLAGAKAEYLKGPLQKYHTHTEGDCQYCDGGRINETLEGLAKGDGIILEGRRNMNNPKREANLANHSCHQRPRPRRLSTRVRQQHQTWHHLPLYHYPHGVSNKSSMFTQPHKPTGRHFSIHPEWGLHIASKHVAF